MVLPLQESSSGSQLDNIKNAQTALAVDFSTPLDNPAHSLQDKTILVTGGASGFGETIVRAFTKFSGTAAIIADMNSDRGQEMERTLRQVGCSVKFIQVNVTDWQSVLDLYRNALAWLKERYGQDRYIDHVVPCAGMMPAPMDFTPEHPDALFGNDSSAAKAPSSKSTEISIVGHLYIITAAMKYAMGLHLKQSDAERGDKSITMFGSQAAYSGWSNNCDYSASKWGVRGLFRSLLNDSQSASCPVRINMVAPHFVATPLIAHLIPALQERGIKLAEVKDVEAATMRFICDKSIHGRAAGVWQGGPVDMCDDYAGDFGAITCKAAIDAEKTPASPTYVTRKREV